MQVLKAWEKCFLALLTIIIAVLLLNYFYHNRSPEIIKETEHYIIYSTATKEQTDEIAQVAEIVYKGYLQLSDQLGLKVQPHPKLKMKLYKNRQEFRRCNPNIGWIEAFYIRPYCYQYYSSGEPNPYHWMMHEATHQLNAEGANLSLPQWIDEGLACYLSTSLIINNSLSLGEIDIHTYPVWWLDSMALSGDMDLDKKNLKIIPLRQIISGQGGPQIHIYFNLYYLHWWTLTHFLMQYEGGKYQTGFSHLITNGGGLDTFEKYIGKIERIEKEWYEYVLEHKQKLADGE
jgi:hypothetical protein